MPVGHADYTAMLSRGLPRHTSEHEAFQRLQLNLESERYPGTGYDLSGLDDGGAGGFGQAPAGAAAPTSDPLSYIMGVLGPAGVGLIAIGAIIYFVFLRKEK
jgi:hypothetical protein